MKQELTPAQLQQLGDNISALINMDPTNIDLIQLRQPVSTITDALFWKNPEKCYQGTGSSINTFPVYDNYAVMNWCSKKIM